MSRASKTPAPARAGSAAAAGTSQSGARTTLLERLDPRAPYLVPALLLVVTRLVLWIRTPWASEDALITFRYAANWAHGLGPVFNAGEKVFGYTSPPWMAWIALGIRVGADPVLWTRATLLVADLGALFVLAALFERHASRASAWCFAYFFAVLTYFSGLLCSGLEMGALIALVALGAWLIERRSRAAGVVLGLLAVFRPEGLLAALVLAVWASWRDRAIAAGIGAAVALALTAYYGSPLPQSVLAKAAVYGSPGPLGAPQWWEWTLPIVFVPGTSEGKLIAGLIVLSSPAAIAGIGAIWAERRSALAAAIAAYAVVWVAFIAVGASYFFWYMAAPFVAWMALASAGLPRLLRPRPHAYVAAALMLASNWLQGGKLYVGRAQVEAGRFGVVADYLQSHGRPGEAVFLEPIGTVGWRCQDLRLIDEVGLVTPEAWKRRRQGSGWYSEMLDRHRPRWAVIRASVLRDRGAYAGVGAPFRDFADEQRALAAYEIAAATDTAASEATLVVLRRLDGAR